MSEYMPTTEEVRGIWLEAMTETSEYFDALSPAEARARFDRWLTAHDRAVAAEAWDEGFDECAEYVNGPDWAPAPPNPYIAYFLADDREGAGEVES